MQRREFLKLSGAGLGSAILLTGVIRQVEALPIEAQMGGKYFRGYRHAGDIFVSEDAGKTWQLHTRLGPDLSIDDLFVVSANQMYVKVGFMQYHFHLLLAKDEKQWKTT